MKSMDCLKPVGKPQTPASAIGLAPAGAMQGLEQILVELRDK